MRAAPAYLSYIETIRFIGIDSFPSAGPDTGARRREPVASESFIQGYRDLAGPVNREAGRRVLESD
jgi:hypothetical protein